MKHNLWITLALILMTAISVLFGVLVAPMILAHETSTIDINPLIAVLFVLVILILAAWMWIILMKHLNPNKIAVIFSIGIGLMLARFCYSLGLFHTGVDAFDVFFYILTIVLSSILFYTNIRVMQSSWKNTQRFIWVANLFMMVLLPAVSIVLSRDFPPWAAIVLLACIAIYDWIAVRKTGHMQKMALFFLKIRVIPGLAVAKKKKESFAILGGGDVFFIVFVATSFYRTDIASVWFTAIGGFLAILFLFLLSKKHKFYPAIPFIFAGQIIAFLLRFILWR